MAISVNFAARSRANGRLDVDQCGFGSQAADWIMGQVHSLPDSWLPVSIAPSDADLEVCVMDGREIHALIFPCRKNGTAWVDAATKKRIDIEPTHWRKWDENRQGSASA